MRPGIYKLVPAYLFPGTRSGGFPTNEIRFLQLQPQGYYFKVQISAMGYKLALTNVKDAC